MPEPGVVLCLGQQPESIADAVKDEIRRAFPDRQLSFLYIEATTQAYQREQGRTLTTAQQVRAPVVAVLHDTTLVTPLIDLAEVPCLVATDEGVRQLKKIDLITEPLW